MALDFIQFQNVSYHYPSSPEVLFQGLNFQLGKGWFGVAGSNGAGKSTLLKLAVGLLAAVQGGIIRPDRCVYCPQRTDHMPEGFSDFCESYSREASILKGKLGVEDDWIYRWSTLSHGERKRAQIGLALWREPDLLAIDEPTNHLDARAKAMVCEALEGFDGIGILVSHDRDLLDSLCQSCLFVDPPHATLRKGGYSKGRRTAEEESKSLEKQRRIKKQALKKLKREAGKRKDKAKQADGKKSKSGISSKDHDAKSKIDAARLTGRDGAAGKRFSQLEGRVDRAAEDLDKTRTAKEYSLGIWLPGAKSLKDRVLDLPEGVLDLGGGKMLRHPALSISPNDRIGLTGPNGVGKSTLIRKMAENFTVSPDHLTYVPQELSEARSREILAKVQSLPNEEKGRLMTIVSCLGSRPHRLLESATPSPGEIRKLCLALGMAREPHVIVMDEPTNHMDLPSIECLEQALAGCPCALVLVSHDKRFLDALTARRWSIQKAGKDGFILEE
ncbi:ATPase components of ABC transporters with duplicated ATPase domains [Desulfatibacillum alkenivorans DSM 16219]|uniref:ATPase components of ABC transporters with duplicated ATPase domains n=1 Tax=Desulfatibacillum alkenivorans DSM 16219 TaxID=1121393 RepID=A0A1M6UW30_9BACT|nr:ATP-binding cassette domain-containing protein [Desulfatibacillum alkenivorans]SHK73428.1 ATPase components of ABC transporters with duplicated ATPase domains [Desulfatibacillum alkenivorans DSM 16219]